MNGRQQIAKFIRANRNPENLPQDRFEWAGEHSSKVRCVLCHRQGYGSPVAIADSVNFDGRGVRWYDRISLWQISCLIDHPWPCSCGRAFTEYASLWRHIGADRPAGWGREGVHEMVLSMAVAS